MSAPITAFSFDNTYANSLDGFYLPASAAGFPDPTLIKFNTELAQELGLDPSTLAGEHGAAIFSGNTALEGATPLAQAYAGHQFGGFSPQLGDGRAILLGEIVDIHGKRRDVQLKGAGPTPFSRRGDGRATLSSVLREYLLGEAMHGLGIPTTRALAAVTTGEPVARDGYVPGAVLTRVAASHIRVGTFQFFAARGDEEKVRTLADYTIARHYPACAEAEHPYLALLLAVAKAQAELIARWMHVGFIHGVMNTDNATVSGETIDYGPCAFMDTYDLATVFSSIDTGGRYAYGNQPDIGKWNIARFAETLLPLIDEDTEAAIARGHEALDAFTEHYERAWLDGMRAKLGLAQPTDDDLAVATGLLSIAAAQTADYTSVFRALAHAARGDQAPATALLGDAQGFQPWVDAWLARLDADPRTRAAIADDMDQVNPIYIPRNHKTEQALRAAVQDDDFEPFDALLAAVSKPFTERPELASLAAPAPMEFYPYRTFCGT
ncbi:MAG: YdiU family protein [Deltaproteobacteria bacterium]|nr:YdiU family protein [Deltaproteobacteria bacterium]